MRLRATLPCFLFVAWLVLTALAGAAPPLGLDVVFGGSGGEPGKFADLRDLTFDARDLFYSLEGAGTTRDRDREYPGNARVQKFDASGKPLSLFSIRDEALDRKGGPRHLAVLRSGQIFVSYPGADLVREFSPDGAKVRDISIPDANALTTVTLGGKERIAVIGAPLDSRGATDRLFLVEGEGSSLITLSQPVSQVADLTADKAGNFYLLAAINALYRFSPDGRLLHTLGAQTQTDKSEDGSEVRHSVALDSKANIYTIAHEKLTRFDPAFTHVTQREVKLHWFEPWGPRIIAMDSKDRAWVANPLLVNHPMLEEHHFRPAVMRTKRDFFEAGQRGVRTTPALGLGLRPRLEFLVEDSVAYDLKPFSFLLVLPATHRQVSHVTAHYRVCDAYGQPVAAGKFEIPLPVGKEVREVIVFTPPRYGWYTADVSILSGGQELCRLAKFGGVTPEYPALPRLTAAPNLAGSTDAPRARFTGLPNMRLDARADPQSLDLLDRALAACEAEGTVPFVQFREEKDCAPEVVRAAVKRFKGRVKVWEVFNEPNFKMPPEKYVTEILAPAAQIIRELDPQAQIMGPAVCGILLPWYEKFYQAGGGKLVDILSIHDYEGHEGLDPVHWRWKFAELRKIMVGSSRVDLQACKLEYSIVSPK